MSVVAAWSTAALSGALALGVCWLHQRRMRVVARACHELRGPLSAARLALHLGTRVGELSRDRLRALDLELGRAALALEDLSGARVGARAGISVRAKARARARGGPRARAAELVDVGQLLSDSVEAQTAAASARGVQLRLCWSGRPACVRIDRYRLAQATGNLIVNAIRHGNRTVEVRGCSRADTVRIEVIDDGPGLPAPVAVLARRGADRAARGPWNRLPLHGHGLAIALAVATAHGGRLAAAPSPQGARLVLELPVAQRFTQVPPAPGCRGDRGDRGA